MMVPDPPVRATCSTRPSRTISNLIVDQTLGNPAAIVTALTRNGDRGRPPRHRCNHHGGIRAREAVFQGGRRRARCLFGSSGGRRRCQPARSGSSTKRPRTPLRLSRRLKPISPSLACRPGRSLLVPNGIELSGANVVLPNVAPDVGLSAPFNSWFTLFGQFFDHGLDLVNKGGNGTVFIPLQPDDPLSSWPDTSGQPMTPELHGADPRHHIAGSRRRPGDNPSTPRDESLDDGRPVNTTTSFVDQNQTYTSHPSHQVFLRGICHDAGRPGRDRQADRRRQWRHGELGRGQGAGSLMLGIELTDQDVGKVPLLRTDPYGNFIPGPNGFPLADHRHRRRTGFRIPADDIVIEGDPRRMAGSGVSLVGGPCAPTWPSWPTSRTTPCQRASRTAISKSASAMATASTTVLRQRTARRAFHRRRRPRQREHRPDRRPPRLPCGAQPAGRPHQGSVGSQRPGDAAEWRQRGGGGRIPQRMAGRRRRDRAGDHGGDQSLVWDGERLFQAAKFGTEMQYQHLVFEEFARKMRRRSTPSSCPTASKSRSIRRSSPSSRTWSIASATRC